MIAWGKSCSRGGRKPGTGFIVERDLETLEQIVALKFTGALPLKQIARWF